jgi:hypothetical protein
MPRFQVLRPVEHNQILYLPPGATAGIKARSAGHGRQIPVDASGTIELDDASARAFTGGQIAPFLAASAEAPEAKQVKGKGSSGEIRAR